MNNNLIIIILLILIILIILFLINNNFKENFICINPEKIDSDKICDSSFQLYNNKNFLNNNTTNGYLKIDYKSDNRIRKNDGTLYIKCADNWDGTLNDFNKVHKDQINKNEFFNKLKEEKFPKYNFSNLELYKCNKTCPPGKGIIDDTNTCLDCPDKQYNTGDSYECKNISECPSSNYRLINYDNKTGYINCKINGEPGYYYDNDTLSEIPCPIGTYNNTYGNTKCIDVSDGYYVDLTGQTTQKPHLVSKCGPGKKLTPGTKIKDGECVDCPPNTYKTDYNSSTSCYPYSKTECGPGEKFIAGTKTTDSKCEDCQFGHYSDGTSSTCKRVSAGYKINADNSDQVICPAGTYSNAGSESCINCPGGTFSSAGSDSCTNCPDGHYSDGVTCTRVQAGYKLKEDKSGEVPCPVGTFSTYGSVKCSDCPDGKYQDEEGKSSCKNYRTSCPNELILGDGNKSSNKLCKKNKKIEWTFTPSDDLKPSGIYSSDCNTTNYSEYDWKCPPGVYKISLLMIGAGGAGAKNGSSGGGGGLIWVNNLEVKPDITYRIIVPNYTTQITEGNSSYYNVGDGQWGESALFSAPEYEWYIRAIGGQGGSVIPRLEWGRRHRADGGHTSINGTRKFETSRNSLYYSGGDGGVVYNPETETFSGGGGGAAGYGKREGNHIIQHATCGSSPGAGFGKDSTDDLNDDSIDGKSKSRIKGKAGCFGGGGGGSLYNDNLYACGGGGVGIYGAGDSGNYGKREPGTKEAAGGKGGSNGSDAVDEHGGLYGGGGAGGPKPGNGAKGIVRILYTPDESARFPDTNVYKEFFDEHIENEGLKTC